MSPRRNGFALAVLGAVNWDTAIFVDAFPGPGEEVRVRKLEGFPGGKGANTAVAAARVLGRGSVSFAGAVGDDEFERPLRESLAAEGVDARGVLTVKGRRTGNAFVVVDRGGAKAIHSHFGANAAFSVGDLADPGVARALSSSSGVVVMDVPLEVALAAAKGAKANRATVFYSPGVRARGSRRLLDRVFRLSDHLVLDRAELSRLDGREPAEAARALQREHPGLVVVGTLGRGGSVVARNGGALAVPPVDLGALGLRAVNSTGSGDAFLGAYASFSVLGLTPEEAAGWGNLAGALKAASEETRGSPTRSVLEARMAELAGVRGRTRGSPSKRA